MGPFANEAELVARAKGGSDQAFGRLVDRHQQAVRAFLRRVCRDRDEADDLAQETFLTAWSRLDSLEADASVRTWLCGIAFRKALTAGRGRARSAARDRQWLDARADTTSPAGADRVVIERAMAELPLDQRACVALCLAGDWTHAEAAEALGLPLGTVKSHVARGRERLMTVMGVKP